MLRVGIVGLGGMGRGRLGYYAQIPQARVEAVADVRCEELANTSLAALFEIPAERVKWFADYRRLTASGAVDMVDICLPTDCHAGAAIAALESGLHVLCEKPMALTLADCDAMIEASVASGRLLMIAHCIRFWPEYETLANLVRSGEAGKLLALQLSRQGPTPRGGIGWMCQTEHSGGAILDLHVHDLDYCQYLLGMPRRIYAQGGKSGGEQRGIDHVLSNLDYGQGLQVSALAQWANVDIPFTAHYEASFERAYLRFDSGQTPTLTVYREGVREPECPTFPSGHRAYLNEIRYFVDCVIEGVEPERCPSLESRQTVALSIGAVASVERGDLVNTDEFAL